MRFSSFVWIWFILTCLLGREYLVLHHKIRGVSLFQRGACLVFDQCQLLATTSDSLLGLTLGWVGFGLLCSTNFYVARKRILSWQRFGSAQGWLNWHIFFGMLGPTCIVFHTNFRVNGLVAVAFWSMIISAVSGVIGRFLYVQIVDRRHLLSTSLLEAEATLRQLHAKSHPGIAQASFNQALEEALDIAGASRKGPPPSLPAALIAAAAGDLRMQVQLPTLPWDATSSQRRLLRDWAVQRRKLATFEQMSKMFGYWKSFHTPFAIFMFIVAIIHVISSLIFYVPHVSSLP